MPLRVFLTFMFGLSVVVSASAAPTSWIRTENEVPPYTLPNPLSCEDGTLVRDAAAWRERRRSEIAELFAREVYGRTPVGRPDNMRWEVTSIDRSALGGKAVRKEVTIHFGATNDAPKIHVLIYQPRPAPDRPSRWPVFLGLNFFGNVAVHADPGISLSSAWVRGTAEQGIVNNRATDLSRGVQASRWEVETVLARGYATATISCAELCPDRVDGLGEGAPGALLGPRDAEQRAPDAWGALGMWAWGLSRAMDYIESDAELDAARVIVHGHSRLGKAVLWAGAQDERFAMVISNNSGCGGAALSKRTFGETVGVITRQFPHWFARNFRQYNGNEAALPVDQHQLIALIAPRPVYIASAEEDLWADPRGEFLALKAAEPVYALFGKRGLGVADMPAVDAPVHGDALAYHIRTGQHDVTPYDWQQFLAFADRMLSP